MPRWISEAKLSGKQLNKMEAMMVMVMRKGSERGDEGAEHPARARALHLGQQALKKKPLISNVYLKSRNEVTTMSLHR